MTEVFDSWHVEVYIGSTWVDLTPDVRFSPAPRVSGVGIMSNNPLDRVGGTSQFTFTLDNSEANSVQQLGYYSPGRAGCLSGWTTGLTVRFYFIYDGIYKSVFYGKINSDGISVVPFEKSNRSVSVTASGWMREAEKASVELINYQTNVRSDDAINAVLANMTNQPLVKSLQPGVETFLTVFDVTSRQTKAAGEFTKILDSEMGFLYVRGDNSQSAYVGGETFVFENRRHRYAQRELVSAIPLHSSQSAGKILLETGSDDLLLESGDHVLRELSEDATFDEGDFLNMQISYGKHLYNRARLTTYPRSVDSSPVILWNLETPLEIRAGSTVRGIRGNYRDPNGKSSNVSGINMIAPVATTDYLSNTAEDGSGTNKTSDLTVTASYGTAEVEYTITNASTSTVYVTLLQARGYGVYIYDTTSVLYESTQSISSYGIQEIEFTMPYISTATGLFSYSNNIDLVLLETGDKILMENGDNLKADDTAGIFDLLVWDEPIYYIEQAAMLANKDKHNMMAFMSLDAGSFIKIEESVTGINTDYTYCINGYDMELIGGSVVKWYPSLISSLRFPRI